MPDTLNNPKVMVLGLSGGSGAGKTFLALCLQEQLEPLRSLILSQDFYYKDQGQIPLAERSRCNYDEPSAIDFSLLIRNLSDLKMGRMIQRPVYNFALHTRASETCTVAPAPVIIVDGILIFSDEQMQKQFDLQIFIETPADVRLMRRLHRDVQERGRSVESVLAQYRETVRPMHTRFVESVKSRADIVVSGAGNLQIFAEMLAAWIKNKMHEPD